MAKAKQKAALGKGIASLIQANATEEFLNDIKDIPKPAAKQVAPARDLTSGVLLVDISQIKVNPVQPRKIFKERELEELSNSIRESGVLQPLVVTQVDQGFELIAGERRLRASKKAGIDKVPVIVKRVTDKEKLVLALIENIQRSDLNCVEEALGYFQLMEDFQLTQEELAKKVGKDRSVVANHLRILKLPREVIELLQAEKISFGHAKVLAGLGDTERIRRLAKEVVEAGLSVRELDKLSKKKNHVEASKTNPFFDEKLDGLRQRLESQTGFHFKISSAKNGAGQIMIKYTNEAEFNDIYEYLLKS